MKTLRIGQENMLCNRLWERTASQDTVEYFKAIYLWNQNAFVFDEFNIDQLKRDRNIKTVCDIMFLPQILSTTKHIYVDNSVDIFLM